MPTLADDFRLGITQPRRTVADDLTDQSRETIRALRPATPIPTMAGMGTVAPNPMEITAKPPLYTSEQVQAATARTKAAMPPLGQERLYAEDPIMRVLGPAGAQARAEELNNPDPLRTIPAWIRGTFGDDQVKTWAAKGPINIAEKAADPVDWIFAGDWTGITKGDMYRRFNQAMERLEKNEYVETSEDVGLDKPLHITPAAAVRKKDEDFARAVLERMAERSIRDTTIGADIFSGIQNLYPFAMQMLVTRKPASLAGRTAYKGLRTIGAPKILAKPVAGLVGAAARMEAMPTPTMAAIEERKATMGETGAEARLNAAADQFIELYTEQIGGDLFKGIKKFIPPKLLKSLDEVRAIRASQGMTAAKRYAEQVGIHGPLEEILEERAGGAFRGLGGLEGDPGDPALVRAVKNAGPGSGREAITEAAVLAAPQLARVGAGGIAARRAEKRIRRMEDTWRQIEAESQAAAGQEPTEDVTERAGRMPASPAARTVADDLQERGQSALGGRATLDMLTDEQLGLKADAEGMTPEIRAEMEARDIDPDVWLTERQAWPEMQASMEAPAAATPPVVTTQVAPPPALEPLPANAGAKAGAELPAGTPAVQLQKSSAPTPKPLLPRPAAKPPSLQPQAPPAPALKPSAPAPKPQADELSVANAQMAITKVLTRAGYTPSQAAMTAEKIVRNPVREHVEAVLERFYGRRAGKQQALAAGELTDAQRQKEIRSVRAEIRKHPLYQDAADQRSQQRFILGGDNKIVVGVDELPGEVRDFLEGRFHLRRYFTTMNKWRETHPGDIIPMGWDRTLEQMADADPRIDANGDINYFLGVLEEKLAAGRTDKPGPYGLFPDVVAELRASLPELDVLATKLEALESGKDARTVNRTIDEIARAHVVDEATALATMVRPKTYGKHAAEKRRNARHAAEMERLRQQAVSEKIGAELRGAGVVEKYSIEPQDPDIQKGILAINNVINNKTDATAAMHRDDIGDVGFLYGQPGDPKKQYVGGWGIAHILAKHGRGVVRKMPEVIKRGKINRRWGPEKGQRIEISHDGHTAILSLYREGNRETWLLTGWKEGPDEAGTKYDVTGPTQLRPTRSQPQMGAESSITIPPESAKSKPVSTDTGENAAKGDQLGLLGPQYRTRPAGKQQELPFEAPSEIAQQAQKRLSRGKDVEGQGTLFQVRTPEGKKNIYGSYKLTTEAIQRAFPGAKITQQHDNKWYVELPNGTAIDIQDFKDLTTSPERVKEVAAQFGISEERAAELKPLGLFIRYEGSSLAFIEIAKIADAGTVEHEAFHAAMAMALTDGQRAAVLKKYGDEEAAARAYSQWRGQKRNPYFERIRDFFRRIAEAFFGPNWRGVFRSIETGKAWKTSAGDRSKPRAAEKYEIREEGGLTPKELAKDKIWKSFDDKMVKLLEEKANAAKLTPERDAQIEKQLTVLEGKKLAREKQLAAAGKTAAETIKPVADKVRPYRGETPTPANVSKIDVTHVPAEEYEKAHTAPLGPSAGERAKTAGKTVWQTAEKLATPISTRLANVSQRFKNKLRKLIYETRQVVKKHQDAVGPWVKATFKFSKTDQRELLLAMFNRDETKIEELSKKYKCDYEYRQMRRAMDEIWRGMVKTGMNPGYWQGYYPLTWTDLKGLMRYFGQEVQDPFDRAVMAREQKINRKLTEGEKIAIINTLMRGYTIEGISLSRPGAARARTVKSVNAEMLRYGEDPRMTMMRYVTVMDTQIKAREFFGKPPAEVRKLRASRSSLLTRLAKLHGKPGQRGPAFDKYSDEEADEHISKAALRLRDIEDELARKEAPSLEGTIGAYVLNLRDVGDITPEQGEQLVDTLTAYFNPGRSGEFIGALRNIGYVATLGDFINALTNLKDFGKALYRDPLRAWPALARAAVKRARISMDDLGVDEIAAEFMDRGLGSQAVRGIFKGSGFTYLDRLGKETYVDTVLSRYRAAARAKKVDADVMRRIVKVFQNKTAVENVLADLREGQNSEDVKLLLFNELLDIQPIAMSEMPEWYLKAGGWGRMAYMLKSFTIRELDFVRNECFKEMAAGHVARGLGRLMKLAVCMMAAGATADFLKRLLLGRPLEPDDVLIDNLLQLLGFNRYTAGKVGKEGVGTAIIETVAPPLDSMLDHRQLTRKIPLVGEFYYWWFGKGAEKSEKERKRQRRAG